MAGRRWCDVVLIVLHISVDVKCGEELSESPMTLLYIIIIIIIIISVLLILRYSTVIEVELLPLQAKLM